MAFSSILIPLAIATPVFNASCKEDPVIIFVIAECLSVSSGFVIMISSSGSSTESFSTSLITWRRFGIIVGSLVTGCTGIFWATGSGFGSSTTSFFGAPGRLSYFFCCKGVNGLYFILSSIAWYTYLPSLNHKIRSSHSSRHSAVIPASWYNFASSYAHFSIYSAFLKSSSAVICSVRGASWAFKILYLKIYWLGSLGANFTNSS